MATSADRRRHWMVGISRDDELWMQAIGVQQDMMRIDTQIPHPNEDEKALKILLLTGVLDFTKKDRPWDSSTRSMRFTSAVGDRLWSLVQQEKSRVGIENLLRCCETDSRLFLE